MELMSGECVLDPSGYGRFVIVIVEVVQVVRVQRSDAAYDLSERIAFDGVNLAVRMPPESSYRVHGACAPKFSLALAIAINSPFKL